MPTGALVPELCRRTTLDDASILGALLAATSAPPTRPAGTIAFDITCVPS
jgi:hypothetical protein